MTDDDGSVATVPAPEAEGDRELAGRLRSSVGIEILLGGAVLALAAVLVSTAPARSTYAQPVEESVQLASGGSADDPGSAVLQPTEDEPGLDAFVASTAGMGRLTG